VLGTSFLTLGVAGYLLVQMKTWERALMVIAGILTCIPEFYSDIAGFVLAAIVVVSQIIKRINKNKSQKEENPVLSV
jgi:TRAP-type uncharacterized transport system fused permease subunit